MGDRMHTLLQSSANQEREQGTVHYVRRYPESALSEYQFHYSANHG